MDAELVLNAKATLGEGAIWHTRGERLYWIDIEPGRLHKLRETYNANLNPVGVRIIEKEVR